MNKLQALHSFWSSFGLKAYDETSVPDNIVYPYITYQVSISDFGNTVAHSASIWYRSSSWTEISEKEMEISEFITRGGIIIAYDNGAMWLQKSNPWCQRIGDPTDDMIRGMILSLTIDFLD